MNSLEEKVLRLIGEDPSDPDVFTDSNITPIRDSINDAIEEIAVLSGNDKVTYRLPLYAGRYFYRLHFPNHKLGWIHDAYLPERKRHIAQTSFGALERARRRWLRSYNTPMTYYTIGIDTIGVYPIYPIDGYHLDLKCVIVPKRYTTESEIIKLREDRESAVISYAVGEYYLNNKDPERAAEWLGRYNKFAASLHMHSTIPDKWRRLYDKV